MGWLKDKSRGPTKHVAMLARRAAITGRQCQRELALVNLRAQHHGPRSGRKVVAHSVSYG